MSLVGTYVSVLYRVAKSADSQGNVVEWSLPFVTAAIVDRQNDDGTVDLTVYNNRPTKDNHSIILGGINAAVKAANEMQRDVVGRWWEEGT